MDDPHQLRPYAEVRRFVSRNVSRATYENTARGKVLVHWPADREQWEKQISDQISHGRWLGKLALWGFAGLGILIVVTCVVVMAIVPAGGAQRQYWILWLMAGGGFVAGFIAWALIRDNWNRKARNMRELGGDVWLMSNGIMRGPDCFPWNHVEKSLNRHYTLVDARLVEGTPTVIDFEVLSTYGPPDARVKAAAMQVAGRAFFGSGGAAPYVRENLRFKVSVPPGEEIEAAAAAQSLLDARVQQET